MTYSTETDIRELKTAVEAIGRGTEANTRAIEGLSRTTDAIDRRLETLTRTTEANAKAIADLTLEMRLGFGDVKGQIGNLDTKLSGQITNLESKLEGKINSLDTKFDERSKGMGQRLDGKELAQRNIFTGITVLIVGGILLAFFKYLFFGTLP
jgi:chromosome segregation ATPase